ncbi:MAG: hypothetical protein FWF83_04655 [Clostridiales bacterium]|nr:hypothetical protein [Clostridiales bacterium]
MKVFEKPGRDNTDEACRIAVERAIAMDNAYLVASTTTGAAGARLCEIAKEMGFGGKMVIVTHAYGSRNNPGENALKPEHRAAMEAYGATLVTAAHALSGVERAMSGKWNGVYPAEMMANTLRLLSQGIKVVVEIGSMAMDNGAIPHGVPIVCAGGTGSGLDTVVVMHPAHANTIFETNIHEILCMPY